MASGHGHLCFFTSQSSGSILLCCAACSVSVLYETVCLVVYKLSGFFLEWEECDEGGRGIESLIELQGLTLDISSTAFGFVRDRGGQQSRTALSHSYNQPTRLSCWVLTMNYFSRVGFSFLKYVQTGLGRSLFQCGCVNYCSLWWLIEICQLQWSKCLAD